MSSADDRLKITDVAIWFKHVHSARLRDRLKSLRAGDEISLETDGIVGSWRRMNTGKDGRAVDAIRPVGAIRPVWNAWFKARRGESIPIGEAVVADEYLAAASALFCEWSSPEDEENFRDL